MFIQFWSCIEKLIYYGIFDVLSKTLLFPATKKGLEAHTVFEFPVEKFIYFEIFEAKVDCHFPWLESAQNCHC